MKSTHEQRIEAFKTSARQLFNQRDAQGNMPTRSTMRPAWNALDDRERRMMRSWIASQQHAAIARCDTVGAHAWAAIRERVHLYPQRTA